MRYFPAALAEAERLGISIEAGLTEAQAAESRARHGENRLPAPKPESMFRMFFTALGDRTLLILLGAAALSIGVEYLEARLRPDKPPHYLEGFAILLAVLIASLVTTINEARAQKQFRMLSKEADDVTVKVLRGGRLRRISGYDLVVGDVVSVETGDRIPADGLLASSVELCLDQAALTGESMPADKGPDDVEMRSGATVCEGTGLMIINQVGTSTELGRLHLRLSDSARTQTPLQERLAKLADQIGSFGLGAAVLTFLALAISSFARGQLPFELSMDVGSQLLDYAIVAVTIVVVAVPEGLPLAVTVSLAYSVRKMTKDKNLVRKLASCETMGAATVIVSDKTGTLTRNRMTVIGGWIGGHAYDHPPRAEEVDGAVLNVLAEIASVNSTAFIEQLDGLETYVGNPTECALLALTARLGRDWRALREHATIVRRRTFTSDRKRMSTLVTVPGGGHRLLVKGAPEVICQLSRARIGPGGAIEPLSREYQDELARQIARLASAGNRTLALAFRDLDEALELSDELERALVLVAIVGIDDPVRAEVPRAIADCRRAGVDVKMVTGDGRLTAEAIARQIGLLEEGSLVLEGDDFRQRGDEEILRESSRIVVLARSIPSDKYRMVTLLQSKGEVVAVTGDGTNDAPALKVADVGFSMGLSGTEVAKEASDIVILDDNFASIARAILWGRSIFENIRKFIQFQLTVNVVALTIAFLAAVLGFGIPLNAVQLLWVNLIMDTLAALALATEPPTEALFLQPPHGRHAPLITRAMWTNILVLGVYMIGVLLLIMMTPWFVPDGTTPGQQLTFVFNTFVFMQLFNEVNARSTRFDRGVFTNLHKSKLFLLVVGTTVVAQILIVELGGAFFRTEPLGAQLWLLSVLVGASTLAVGALLRVAGRPRMIENPARA